MNELKPCPFCGSERVNFTPDEEQQLEDTTTGFIWCHGCDFSSDSFYSKEIAADKWNRRPAPENKPLTLEQLTLDQLRQMDGEPVWWWNKSHAPVCTICIARFNEVSFVDFDYSHDDSTGIVKYERWVKWGFKPYARKPEQEATT